MILVILIVVLGYLFSTVAALRGKRKLRFHFKPINLEKLGKGCK